MGEQTLGAPSLYRPMIVGGLYYNSRCSIQILVIVKVFVKVMYRATYNGYCSLEYEDHGVIWQQEQF